MADILFIKTSSLGDVVHHMPALTDARRALPDAHFAWVVEEAFAPLARLHPALTEVIPVAWRRWRKSMLAPATLAEIRSSLRGLRARRYDTIVDSQGLLRTAILARFARGRRHGYDAASIREPLASLLYDVRHSVSYDLHAVERKADWITLGKALGDLTLLLPWGTETERGRSERLAAALPRARVPERAPLDRVAQMIAGAQFVVGVDTGLMHLAAAFGVPLVAIFSGSKPALTGPVGAGPMTVLGADGSPPPAETVVEAVRAIGC
jgi:heptosyltransferase-1